MQGKKKKGLEAKTWLAKGRKNFSRSSGGPREEQRWVKIPLEEKGREKTL